MVWGLNRNVRVQFTSAGTIATLKLHDDYQEQNEFWGILSLVYSVLSVIYG
jgi:hypothetical protein